MFRLSRATTIGKLYLINLKKSNFQLLYRVNHLTTEVNFSNKIFGCTLNAFPLSASGNGILLNHCSDIIKFDNVTDLTSCNTSYNHFSTGLLLFKDQNINLLTNQLRIKTYRLSISEPN